MGTAATTVIPTLPSRGNKARASSSNLSRCEPRARKQIDALCQRQCILNETCGLTRLHCLSLGKAADDGKAYTSNPRIKQLQSISEQLLALQAAVGSGKWLGGYEVLPQLSDDISQLHEKYVAGTPTAFHVNCALAVVFDRGTLGACLPSVVDILPHNTPGSYCWFEKDIGAGIKEAFVTNDSFHRKLNPAGVTYKHMDLLRSNCDTLTAGDGTPITLISYQRTSAPGCRLLLEQQGQTEGYGFHRSEGTWSFVRDSTKAAIKALLVAELSRQGKILDQLTDNIDKAVSEAAEQAECTIEAEFKTLLSIDAFNALSRRKQKACAVYLGPGRMTPLGLAVGNDDIENITASFGTPSQTFTDSGGAAGHNSLFGQLQELVDNPAIEVQLPTHLPKGLSGEQLYLNLVFHFVMDQPAAIAFTGLEELGYSCTGAHFNIFSPEPRATQQQIWTYYDIDTGRGYNPYTQSWECYSPETPCGDCNNCAAARTIADNPMAWGLNGRAPFTVTAGCETLASLGQRTGEDPECIAERNGIAADFAHDQPLVELPADFQSIPAASLGSVGAAGQHPVAQAISAGNRVITLIRITAYGLPGGYPDAMIKSDKLLTILQIPFMHMAKAIIWRWILRLWQAMLTLDESDALKAGKKVAGINAGSVQEFLANRPRAQQFLAGTVVAGNEMEVNLSKQQSESFDMLRGNKDLRPLLKLLHHRDELMLAMQPEERRHWQLAGEPLEQWIDLVWEQGCYTPAEKALAIRLCFKFVWRFSECIPTESFNNYTLQALQFPLLQPDPTNVAVISGVVINVDKKLDLFDRPTLKLASDENGEAMHRVIKQFNHNQGGGKPALMHPGSCEATDATVQKDLLGLQHICNTIAIKDLETMDCRVPCKARQRNVKYKQLPASDKMVVSMGNGQQRVMTVLEVLLFHETQFGLRWKTEREGGIHRDVIAAAAEDSGLSKDKVEAWARGRRYRKEYQRRIKTLPFRTTLPAQKQQKGRKRARRQVPQTDVLSSSEEEAADMCCTEGPSDSDVGRTTEAAAHGGQHATAGAAAAHGHQRRLEAAVLRTGAAVPARTAAGKARKQQRRPSLVQKRRPAKSAACLVHQADSSDEDELHVSRT